MIASQESYKIMGFEPWLSWFDSAGWRRIPSLLGIH